MLESQQKNIVNSGADPLMEFQLAQVSPNEKSKPEFGIKIARKIWQYTNVGIGGYFYNRNAQFIQNRNYANGIMDVQAMFQDRFQFNGKQNYIRLDWQTLQLCNRIISGLVGRWMDRNEKIEVTATDDRSQKNKQQEYEQIEFHVDQREKLLELQEQSGVQMIPNEDKLPVDQDELTVWKQQFLKLPEEIETEMACNDVLEVNGLYDVVKEKMLHDSAEVGFVGTKTEMDETGEIKTRWVKPEDSIYSWTEYPDFRDATWMGEAPSIKISELRRRFGKEFHPNDPLALTEDQLFAIAQTSKDWQYNTNLVWTNSWVSSYFRPYDEWNVRSIDFELKSVDNEKYTITNTRLTGSTYVQKGVPVTKSGKPKDKPSENQKVVDDSNINIYECVYLPDNDKLLRWRVKRNMIRPQDPRESGNAEFSYSFYMYQNYLMRNLAIPQKIKAAIDGMILALLKMQQVVARMRPTGAAIDESALENIDYGLGEAGNKAVDHKTLYDQTGDIYYRGIDAEGRKIGVPIQELANSGFLNQMQGLIANYQFWYQTLKDELGEDPNLITSALQPRVTGENVNASRTMAEYATDYMYRAYAECVKLTAKKVSCLVSDSVKYGSSVYRKIVKQEIPSWVIFNTNFKLLPSNQEIAIFEGMMNQSIAANPDLLMFTNPFMLTQMAKEDVKLAWLMFDNGRKKMLLNKRQETIQNQQATIQGQIQSAQASEEAKQETEKIKGNFIVAKEKEAGLAMNKNATIQMVSSILSKGLSVPAQYQPFVDAVIQNIMLPLAIEDEQTRNQVAQQMQSASQMQQQPAQPEQPEINDQPQEQNIEQQQPEMAA